MGTQLPSPKGGHSRLNFGPCLLWPNGWMDQDATWYAGRPRPRPHCARWGPSSPQESGTAPQFSAHICCGQMAGWIEMPVGREIGLGPSDIVSDGNPAARPQERGHSSQIFGPCLLWPKGWMDQDATWYEGRPRPRRHCVTRGPSSPPKRGTAPNFRPMSIVAKRLPISATAEHLLTLRYDTQ